MQSVTLNVPDISCGHCERTILNALQGVDGVRAVRVDILHKQVALDYEPARLTLERVKEILAEEDYPVESVVAARPARPAVFNCR